MTKILNCLWHRVEAMIFVTSYNAYYELKTACAWRVWINSSFIKCILTDTRVYVQCPMSKQYHSSNSNIKEIFVDV